MEIVEINCKAVILTQDTVEIKEGEITDQEPTLIEALGPFDAELFNKKLSEITEFNMKEIRLKIVANPIGATIAMRKRLLR